MKRGLKDSWTLPGTLFSCVTTVTPMKRGLKVWPYELFKQISRGYNRYPDEKGTERADTAFPTANLILLQPLPR